MQNSLFSKISRWNQLGNIHVVNTLILSYDDASHAVNKTHPKVTLFPVISHVSSSCTEQQQHRYHFEIWLSTVLRTHDTVLPR